MSINWDIVKANAEIKAAEQARKYKTEDGYYAAKNSYFQGYMECAGERESLRVINAELEKRLKEMSELGMSLGKALLTVPEYTSTTSSDLEGLI